MSSMTESAATDRKEDRGSRRPLRELCGTEELTMMKRSVVAVSILLAAYRIRLRAEYQHELFIKSRTLGRRRSLRRRQDRKQVTGRRTVPFAGDRQSGAHHLGCRPIGRACWRPSTKSSDGVRRSNVNLYTSGLLELIAAASFQLQRHDNAEVGIRLQENREGSIPAK